ncbi:BfmA/BtgA family mobilization protein [Flagellimonas onchidii]|uniref:BfmA/BtgA family mobilization protein n=1 Tax=Flagellimonas onchidii TaxID=2562684 RepID=UPI0010A6A1FF|nr:BfmA/BtgA family mobilization protein [Allomuricauda onchidii]
MDAFKTVRIKNKTLSRFKSFSIKVSKSYSRTLDMVMDFFEWHGFLPDDRFGKSMVQEILKNRKRTEAMIAIIKDIEKNQTKPTNAMLLSLFEGQSEEEDEMVKWIEKIECKPLGDEVHIETTVPKIRYERLEDKMGLIKKDFGYVLDNVKLIKSSFGKNYFRLELTEGEIEKFKREIRNL